LSVRTLIAGGSGFLGQKLAARLAAEGHRVQTLTRRGARTPDEISWNPDGSPGALPAHLEGADALVNLAGENLAGGRWTAARKQALISSRVLPTRTLARAIAACARPPRVFVSASAVGYYGPHGDEPVTEATPPGSDFLARICVDWEQEARAAESPQTRLAIVRSAVVLAKDGGALKKMLLPFKLGGGATLGSGMQYFPWIHADDWSSMVAWLIGNHGATGAFNAGAPKPVTNHTFTKTLARVLGRPAILRAPAFALHAAMGEMADMLLQGQRVMPVHAEQLGFQFRYRELGPALESLDL
jgi:uncharacterized protein (TIGR01777 family)